MNSRAPKQLGDFGEGLVTYALIRKGFEVACVDHVGADLIAERRGDRIAISVKTRLYKLGSIETRGIVIEFDHVEKLEHFATRFQLQSVFAHVVSIADDRAIHLFMLRVADIKANLDKGQHGYRFRFSNSHLQQTLALPYVDYSVWRDETIGTRL
jgi:Holliday junction resolvase